MGCEQTPCFGCWWNRGIAYAIQLQCACDLYHMVFTLKMNIMCCKLQSELHAVQITSTLVLGYIQVHSGSTLCPDTFELYASCLQWFGHD